MQKQQQHKINDRTKTEIKRENIKFEYSEFAMDELYNLAILMFPGTTLHAYQLTVLLI